jgi:site-specific DNA recombinase
MRVAIYIRVSTNNQVQQQTIERQLERLSTYMQSQSWPLPAEHIFRDDGFSGASFKRPALEQLRTQVRARAFDRVLLTAPDRLARNYVHQVLLIDEFAQAGCQVEFLDRPMSDDPHDQLLLQIRGAVAEYERTLITERTRRGRLAKIQAGLLLPWIQPPYGYVVDPEHPRDPARIQHDPVAASVVRELFALYIEERTTLRGLSLHLYQRQIPSPTSKARWGLATLQGILRNPVYTGKVYTGRWQYRAPQVRRSATHPLGRSHDSARPVDHTEWTLVAQIPALVSDEDFARVQAKLVQTQQRAARNNTAHAYLLRALVSCGKCQRACVGVTRRKYQYYLCSGKWHPIHSGQEEPCPARHIPVAQLDELVWQDLCAILRDPQQITAALERLQGGDWLPQELQMRGENLRKGQRSLEQQVERLTEAYLATVIGLEEYQRRRREVEQKLQGLGEQEAQLRHQALRHQEVAGLVANIEEFCGRVAQGLAMADFAQKRQLVELLIDRVVVTDEEVEIRYAIPTSPRGEQVRFYQLRTDYYHPPDLILPHNGQIPQQETIDSV